MRRMSKKRYAQSGGVICPKCNSMNLQADNIEVEDGVAWQNVDCLDCGAYWTDHYHLVGYDNFHEKDDEVRIGRVHGPSAQTL